MLCERSLIVKLAAYISAPRYFLLEYTPCRQFSTPSRGGRLSHSDSRENLLRWCLISYKMGATVTLREVHRSLEKGAYFSFASS